MRYREFGKSGMMVSEIGFGAWAIGGGAMIGSIPIGWGDVDDKVSTAAISKAIETGINFFDTADIYGLGHSEELLGKTIGKRQEIIIASKVGNVARNNEFLVDYSKEYIIAACEESLRRLQRTTIDYYQLHTARMAHLEKGDCLAAMDLLQQQGKIRHWGLSLNTFDPEPEAEFLMKQNLGNGFQLVLNMLNQKAVPLLKSMAAKGYGIIARMPLQFGLLTGKFDNVSSFSTNDHRKNRLTRDVIDSANTALDPVWALCEKYKCNKTQLALSYILSYPEISVIIPGIRTPQHVLENSKGFVQLERQDIALIEGLGRSELPEVMELIRSKG